MQGDEDFSGKCQLLKLKLDHLLQVLREEQQQVDNALQRVFVNFSPVSFPPSLPIRI